MLYSCTHMATVGIKGLQCYRMIRVNFSSPTMMTGLLQFTLFIRWMQTKCQAPANHQADLGWESTCRLLLAVSSLGPGHLNVRQWYCVICTACQYVNVLSSRWPCWCINVGTAWLQVDILLANLIARRSVSSTLCCIWTTFCSTHDD